MHNNNADCAHQLQLDVGNLVKNMAQVNRQIWEINKRLYIKIQTDFYSKRDDFRTSKETGTITFLDDDEELLLWECPPDSSDNESRLSVDWQFLKARPFPIFIPRGGVDPVIFSGDDSSVKLCIGGEASLPEFAPFFDPTKIKSRYKVDNRYFKLRIMYYKPILQKEKAV